MTDKKVAKEEAQGQVAHPKNNGTDGNNFETKEMIINVENEKSATIYRERQSRRIIYARWLRGWIPNATSLTYHHGREPKGVVQPRQWCIPGGCQFLAIVYHLSLSRVQSNPKGAFKYIIGMIIQKLYI